MKDFMESLLFVKKKNKNTKQYKYIYTRTCIQSEVSEEYVEEIENETPKLFIVDICIVYLVCMLAFNENEKRKKNK